MSNSNIQSVALIVACMSALAVVWYPQTPAQIWQGAQTPVYVALVTTPITSHLLPFVVTRYTRFTADDSLVGLHWLWQIGALLLCIVLWTRPVVTTTLDAASCLAAADILLATLYVVPSTWFPALVASPSSLARSIVKLVTSTLVLAAAFVVAFSQFAPPASLTPGNGLVLALVMALAIIEAGALCVVPWYDQVFVGVLYIGNVSIVAQAAFPYQQAAVGLVTSLIAAVCTRGSLHERLRMAMYLCVIVTMSYCVAAGVVMTQWISFVRRANASKPIRPV
jgi:hypothetical protein